MELHFAHGPAVTVAFALAAGVLGQSVAHHLRVPGIVVLLVLGTLLGPDGVNLVRPESLGAGLPAIVGFAVAVILFEGGMCLDLRRLKRSQRAIQQLITLGALVSLVAGMLLPMLVMGWEWQRSLLFGTLVIVTGPTVVTPLLRRLRVRKNVATVLEAEGVLIDAVGAITAAVALELVISPSGQGLALAFPTIAGRLLFGAVLGAVGGFVIAGLLRYRGVIPEGLENVLTLGLAVAVFETANATVHESGIAAVTVAGLVVGNMHTHVSHELAEFKEQLTVMLIGMLFVLLVADVRLADIAALGWPGAIVAALVIVVVRPLSVAAGTWRTTLTTKERVFTALIGPRGIVAAAVASIFGFALAGAEIEGGTELRSLVFLVIAVTVGWSALVGGPAARLLGLKRKSGDGWVVVGGSLLARRVARLLEDCGAEVVGVDNHADHLKGYEEDGVRAIQGNVLEPVTLAKAQLDTRAGAIALTQNEEVNYLFGEKARLSYRNIRYGIALTQWEHGVTPEMVHDFGGEVLFGATVDVDRWSRRLDDEEAEVIWFRFVGNRKSKSLFTEGDANPAALPLVHRRKKIVEPVTLRTRFRRGSEVAFLVDEARALPAREHLVDAGFVRVDVAAAAK